MLVHSDQGAGSEWGELQRNRVPAIKGLPVQDADPRAQNNTATVIIHSSGVSLQTATLLQQQLPACELRAHLRPASSASILTAVCSGLCLSSFESRWVAFFLQIPTTPGCCITPKLLKHVWKGKLSNWLHLGSCSSVI